jgi:hypothetical protein
MSVFANKLRRKRTGTETLIEEQFLYEQAIRADDFEAFEKFFASDAVQPASLTAINLASHSPNQAYFEKIMSKIEAKDMRQLLAASQQTSTQTAVAATDDVAATDAVEAMKVSAPATGRKKARLSTAPIAKATAAAVAPSAVDRVFAMWPFQTARVAWTDKYKARPSSEAPLQPVESAALWQELFQVANAFLGLGGEKSDVAHASTGSAAQTLQEQLFERVESAARLEKGVRRGADESLEAKFLNCRQTTRMVFSRLLFIEQMTFLLVRRGAATDDGETKLDFAQLLAKYAVPIPPASSFKGKMQAFASQFQQHINEAVFQKKDVSIASIEYVK